jgi:hypothetical protein
MAAYFQQGPRGGVYELMKLATVSAQHGRSPACSSFFF